MRAYVFDQCSAGLGEAETKAIGPRSQAVLGPGGHRLVARIAAGCQGPSPIDVVSGARRLHPVHRNCNGKRHEAEGDDRPRPNDAPTEVAFHRDVLTMAACDGYVLLPQTRPFETSVYTRLLPEL